MNGSVSSADWEFSFKSLPRERDGLIGRCVLDERDVTNSWRMLFVGKEVTGESLAKAEALLDGMTGESPLHARLAKELDDIRKLQKKKKK